MTFRRPICGKTLTRDVRYGSVCTLRSLLALPRGRKGSKGRLARYKDKVEHFRMTKGPLGVALRQHLVADQVLSLEGSMYFLEPNVLGDEVGVSFQDLKLKRYSPQSRAYLQNVLDGLGQ